LNRGRGEDEKELLVKQKCRETVRCTGVLDTFYCFLRLGRIAHDCGRNL